MDDAYYVLVDETGAAKSFGTTKPIDIPSGWSIVTDTAAPPPVNMKWDASALGFVPQIVDPEVAAKRAQTEEDDLFLEGLSVKLNAGESLTQDERDRKDIILARRG